jgi:hypothetical protein
MPIYGKNFSSKFLYLQDDIAVGFLDFQNPKEIRKYKIRRFPLGSLL